jgi:hypothetical protein
MPERLVEFEFEAPRYSLLKTMIEYLLPGLGWNKMMIRLLQDLRVGNRRSDDNGERRMAT